MNHEENSNYNDEGPNYFLESLYLVGGFVLIFCLLIGFIFFLIEKMIF